MRFEDPRTTQTFEKAFPGCSVIGKMTFLEKDGDDEILLIDYNDADGKYADGKFRYNSDFMEMSEI